MSIDVICQQNRKRKATKDQKANFHRPKVLWIECESNVSWEGLNSFSFHHSMQIPHVIRLLNFSFYTKKRRIERKYFLLWVKRSEDEKFIKKRGEKNFLEMKFFLIWLSGVAERNFRIFNSIHCNLVSSSFPAFSSWYVCSVLCRFYFSVYVKPTSMIRSLSIPVHRC